MRGLPRLDDPTRYAGLYVFDFGDRVAVGYTASEIAVLLDSDEHAAGEVFKIVRAYPDGRMELKGVPGSRMRASEDGFLFRRRDAAAARRDYEDLRALLDATPPPCPCRLDLARTDHAALPHAVALVCSGPYADEVGAWLSAAGYAGGDCVEGGIEQVAAYAGSVVERLDQHRASGRPDRVSRDPQEVLSTTHVAVQR